MITLLNIAPYTDATVASSPNHDARKSPAIMGIVLHATADEGNEAHALAWMRSPRSGVSCHLLVGRNGYTTRLVGDQQRAWHAGLSWWQGTSDVNSISLGIEIANRNNGEPFTDAQYRRVAEIVAHYCRQGLSVNDVAGHSDIASDRRSDPVGWDWNRFRGMVQQLLRPAPVAAQRPVTPLARQQLAARGSKSALCSKTMWLNGITMLAAGSVLIGDTLDLAFSVGLNLPQDVTMWALFGVGMVNIVLRLNTSCGIGSGGDSRNVHRAPPETMRVASRIPARDVRRVSTGKR